MRRIAGMASTVVIMVACAWSVLAQEGTPADVAAKISGSWKLNLELSPSVAAPGRSGGRGRSPGGGASLAVGLAPLQRGGGRGSGGGGEPGGEGGAEMPPEEIVAQRVLQAFQQVPTAVTITATPASVSFKDPSGQGTFAIDGKTVEITVEGSKIKVKSKWERAALKQEFSTSRRKVIRSWGLDATGHLILAMKVESMMMSTIETRAVFDKLTIPNH
jgi:hypothetical protein